MLTTHLRNWLRHPEMRGVDLDGDERIAQHARVLSRKPMLNRLFSESHRQIRALDDAFFGDCAGSRIELGAGVCPVRNTFADVLATDVVEAPHLDGVLDAQSLQLADASVRVLYAQDCFHHLAQPAAFFTEAARVLAPGGGVILIEPYYGPLASLIYRKLHPSEVFDKTAAWHANGDAAPMTGANQALSFITFVRDRAKFDASFPALELVFMKPLANTLRYLFSGGLNFRQLCPDAVVPVLRLLDAGLSPLAHLLAVHHIVVLRRRQDV